MFSWKKNAGTESQGACRQDKLLGDNPPVVNNSDSHSLAVREMLQLSLEMLLLKSGS
jgi:hypothetical protein